MEDSQIRQAQTDYDKSVDDTGYRPLTDLEKILAVSGNDFHRDGGEMLFGNCTVEESDGLLASLRVYARRMHLDPADYERLAAAEMLADNLIANVLRFLDSHPDYVPEQVKK